MNVKNIFILLVFILFSIGSNSQKPQIDFGPKLKKPLSKELIRHLYSDSTGHYLLFKSKSTKLVIEKYGNDLKPFFSKKFPDKKIKIMRQHISFANDKFIWMYTTRNKKAKTVDVMLSMIDLEGNIIKSQNIKTIPSGKDEPWYHIRWTLSEDKSKLLITGRTSKMKKSTFDFRGWTVVVDENHDLLWESGFLLDHPSNIVRLKYWKVTNSGKALLAADIFTEGNKKRNDLLRFFSVSDENGFEEIELNPRNEKISSHRFIERENGDLLGVAFIYDSVDEKKVSGILKIDINGKDFSFKSEYCDFPKKSFAYGKNNPSDPAVEDGANFLFHFKILDIYFNEKNEIVIVSEENAHTIKAVYDKKAKQTVNKNFYISNQIGVVTINESPKVLDISLIPKKQTFKDFRHFTEHSRLKTNGQTFYIYNDHKKNIEDDLISPESYKKLEKQRTLTPVISYIDESGKLIRQQLYSRKEVQAGILPRVSKQIGPNKFLLVGFYISPLKYESIRLGILTIE